MPVGRGGGAGRRRWWRQGGCRPSTSLFAGCLTPLHPTHALYYVVGAYWWQPAHNQVPYVCGQGMASGRRPHTTLPARRWSVWQSNWLARPSHCTILQPYVCESHLCKEEAMLCQLQQGKCCQQEAVAAPPAAPLAAPQPWLQDPLASSSAASPAL